MKVNVQTKGVIITSKQKALFEKKLAKLKKYLLAHEPVVVDIILSDQTGPEKGGLDQNVSISITYGKEKIFVEETDNRVMRAFAYAFDRVDRTLKRNHLKQVDKEHKVGEERFEKVFGFLKRGRKKK